MTSSARICAALFCLGALSGCSVGGDWRKAGADAATTAREYDDCRDLAETATSKDREIDQDIAATRGADLQHSLIVQTRTAQMGDKTRRGAESIIASCMQQKGFHQSP